MAKVSELKERARGLEQQGELAKAQAIYAHILKHLEGTPALVQELPLYVKVGDLALKQGHPVAAVASYREVARYYARAGSSRSIRALVRKIRAADPSQGAIAIDLGKELLLHGHAEAAAEVIAEYAREQSREDVASLLGGVADEGSETAARALVESGLSLLAQAPEPEAPAEAETPAEPEAPAESRAQDPGITSSMGDELGEGRRVSGQEIDVLGLGEPETQAEQAPAAGGADELRFLSIEDEAAAAEDERQAAAADEAAEEAAAAEAAAAEAAAAEAAAAEAAAAEAAAAAAAAAEAAAAEAAAAKAAEEAAEAEQRAAAEQAALEEALAPSEPVPSHEEEPEPEAVPAPTWQAEGEPAVEEPEPAPGGESEPEPQPEHAWEGASSVAEPQTATPPAERAPSGSRVLVGRRGRESESNRTPMFIAGGVAVVVVGAAALWFSGVLSGGGSVPPQQQEPATTPGLTTADSGAQASDTTTAADTAARQDTTQFGPVGFNAVSESVQAAPPSDTTAGADTGLVADVPDSLLAVPPGTVPAADTTPPAVTAPSPAAALPTIVVPPGYATTPEIVVVPGLEVLSVAEISVGGRIGHRVVQRTPEGVEVSIQAVPGDFAADTVGARALEVTASADTAIGTLRFWQYLVEARAVLPTNTLSTLLTQLERRRPVE